MQLIIDIPEEDYEYIRENKYMHYTMTTGICEAIFEGIPLEEELKKIKKELNNLDFDFGNYYDETEAILNKINSVLDKHIKENKQ